MLRILCDNITYGKICEENLETNFYLRWDNTYYYFNESYSLILLLPFTTMFSKKKKIFIKVHEHIKIIELIN